MRIASLTALVCGALLAATMSLNAQSIGLHFPSNRDNAQVQPGEIAGAFPQANWNYADGGDDNDGVEAGTTTNRLGNTSDIISPNSGVLTDSNGNITPALVEWTSNGTWNTSNGTATPDAKLMNGYIDAFENGDLPLVPAHSTVSFTGIPYSRYDALVYVGSDGNNREGQVSDGTTTYYYLTQSNDPNGGGGFDPATDYLPIPPIATSPANRGPGNFAIFPGLTDSNLDINIVDWTSGNNNGIHAVQLIRALSSFGVHFPSDRDNAQLGAGEVAGVVPQAWWNTSDGGADPQANASGNTTNIVGPSPGVLTDSNGSTMPGTQVEWTSNGTWNTTNGTATPDAKLMNGYIDAIGADDPFASVSITGIPFASYDAIVYFGSDGNGRTGQVTDGTTTYSYSTFSNEPSGGGFGPADFVQTTDTGMGFPDSNFAVFSGLTDPNVNFDILRGSNNSGIHAVQIVEIPEPSSAMLAALACIGLCGYLGRRRLH